MAFEIAKAGWLHRQSTVLHRWKRNWFVLYTDGHLKYFESPDSHVAEQAILMPGRCNLVKKATQVANVTPPARCSVEWLLALVFNDETWIMCAESLDDMTSWYLAFEESRVIRRSAVQCHPPPPLYVSPPPGYAYTAGYPRQVYYGAQHPPYVVQSPNAQTTVIYTDPYPYYYRRGYDGTDMAMGMVAGAAIGSMMWGPMLWW